MDITKENYNPNPRDKANPISMMFFGYTLPIFKKGYSKTLDVDDLYNPLKSDRSELLGDRLERNWKKHLSNAKKRNKTPSLLKALINTFWPEYLFLAFILVISDVLVRLLQPQFLGLLLEYFKPNSQKTKDEALLYAGGIVMLSATSAFLVNHYIMQAFHYGMKIRAACCALIYRKALKLSKSALSETASGQIVNLLSNDVSRFDIVSIFIHHMWAAPLTGMIVAYLLFDLSGLPGLIGMVPIFLIMPLQSYTGKLSSIYRRQTAYKTDERVRLMDEIISGIQVIKMYAWEIPFGKIIRHARKLEIKIIRKLSYVRALFMTFNLFTTRVALFCSLLCIVLSGESITASKVFVFMSYYAILAQSLSTMFVRGVSEIAEVMVSIKRLQNFLLNEEFVQITKTMNGNIKYNNNDVLRLKNATAKWNPNSSDIALSGLSLSLDKGKLLGIVGPVGSGKSSLLQALLGELDVIEGTIDVNGTIAYASQEPWVFAATIRQNILFGKDYNKKRYDEVVRVCALETDFQQFPDGDFTVVGDRGASLSGGQKARINLARAVYREADIYLLDDPLSAVDTRVAKHLFEKCINGFLSSKTRVLVTHQVYYLKDATDLIILNNGKIESQGSAAEVAAMGSEYASLLTTEPPPEEKEKIEEKNIKPMDIPKISRQISMRSRTSSIASTRSETSIIDVILQEENDEELKTKDFTVKGQQEESSKGKIKGSLLFKYLLAGGNVGVVSVVIISFILAQGAASGVDWFVSYWTNIEEFRNATSHPEINLKYLSTETCLYIYGSLIGSLLVIALLRSIWFYQLAMRSSKNMHHAMFDGVVYSNMRFFDTNPSGRILNRFSKDIGTVDELLPKSILDSTQILLIMAGALALVAIVNPLFLIPVAIIGVIFMFLRAIFLKSSKNIKRLEGITRSPVFTHLNATLQGLTTIRAYGAQEILKNEFDKHQDLHTSAWFMYIAVSSAFGFILDLFCTAFITVVTFSFLTFAETLLGGQVGLAISQTTSLSGIVQWGMRQSAEVANMLMSVERVLEYTILPPEKQPIKPIKPSKDWPQNGKISFKNMGLRYADDSQLVLKNLNINIQPKEKIGIVGRTGAGKSSLITALFRLAKVEGEIVIDSIDTKDLILQELRSKISIIPQDPVLFSGTLRYNLDPFEEFPDDLLYKALNDVELKDPTNTINRLENRVMDRGANYSVGQRQLICLARAIIRNNKILMLDEATANVDPQTDALIQKTIRQKFADCTVLTVAHRLNTIMDSDKVLVMDAGTLVEFNHPHILLQNPRSTFSKMVAETGKTVTEQLKQIAKNNYESKFGVPE